MLTRKSPLAITSCDFQWLGKCFILSYTIKKLPCLRIKGEIKGFTLIELIVAVTIAAILLLLILPAPYPEPANPEGA